jgi:hypothetical protein
VSFRFGAISAGVEGRADLPTSQPAENGGSVTASLLAGSVVPCIHPEPMLVCWIATVGALRGSGAGVPRATDDVTPYAATGPRVGVEIDVSRTWSAGVHFDVAATLTRTTLRLDRREVWTTLPVSAALGLRLAADFL